MSDVSVLLAHVHRMIMTAGYRFGLVVPLGTQ